MRYTVSIGASCVLLVLVYLTLYFAPPPPEKVDKTKVPDEIPFVLAGSGGADEEQTEVTSIKPMESAKRIPAWSLNCPFDANIDTLQRREATPFVERAADQVDHAALDDSIVLGISWNGQHRAYAVSLFAPDRAALVNDVAGGDPIVVSLCPHSGSAVAAVRRHGDVELTFVDTGCQWRGNTLWRDRETESIWCQLLVRAVSGQLAGQSLSTIPVTVTSWEKWRFAYPESILVLPQQSNDPSTTYDWLTNESEYGVGVRVLDGNVFYTLADLIRAPLRRDEIKYIPIVIVYFPNRGIVTAFQRLRVIQDFEVNENGQFVDRLAATTWDLASGKAIAGREAGQQLEPVRYLWCRRTAWEQFFQQN